MEGFHLTRSDICEMEIFLTNPEEHFEPCMTHFKEYVGDHRPAGTLIGVPAMACDHQLIEIRAVAYAG